MEGTFSHIVVHTFTEMSEEMKGVWWQQEQQHAPITIKRDGNSFVYTIVVEGVVNKKVMTLNTPLEWREKEENPFYNINVCIYLLVYFVIGYFMQNYARPFSEATRPFFFFFFFLFA